MEAIARSSSPLAAPDSAARHSAERVGSLPRFESAAAPTAPSAARRKAPACRRAVTDQDVYAATGGPSWFVGRPTGQTSTMDTRQVGQADRRQLLGYDKLIESRPTNIEAPRVLARRSGCLDCRTNSIEIERVRS